MKRFQMTTILLLIIFQSLYVLSKQTPFNMGAI
uniref:Uncharacterized protein n=1 Tax=Anguilla anguilla TaxID=7936 RepID=A0A0E9XK83_ANGAN